MKKEEITQEWAHALPKGQRSCVDRMKRQSDFLVMGTDVMPFIEEVAEAYDYNIVKVDLKTLDDLRGEPVVHQDEETGLNYYDFNVDWEEAIAKSDKRVLLIFNIDEAEDRLVSALKSIIERHGDDYFVCLTCSDKTRNLERTTTYDLVKPVMEW